jgi:hypothetical protein
MRRVSRQQLTCISGGVHWFPNSHGGFSAPGSQALQSVAHERGGSIPTKINSDGIGIIGSVVGGSLGTLLGPVGAAVGTMLGQGMKLVWPAVKDAADGA